MSIALNTLSSALHVFTEFTKEADVQVQALQTFLIAATVSNPSNKEVEQRIGLSQAAASRNLKKLCEPPRGQEGYGLITVTPNPVDHRKRIVRLTARGHELMRRIEDALVPPIRSNVLRELITR